MTVPPGQQETVVLLRRLTGAAPTETHISLVFVGSDCVLKLRKAVKLEFLDLTGLDERGRYAHRELELNAPAAPGLYRDVLPIVRLSDGRLALGASAEENEIVDWVVRMARVPADDFFERRAEQGRLIPSLLDALADAVAAFHGSLGPSSVVDAADTMAAVVEQNAGAALGAGLPDAAIKAWRDDALCRCVALRDWMQARNAAGFVRRGHGDLHLGNVCLWRGRATLFDALEFDEALATIDLGYDLAFLLMDLDQRVGRAAANRVLNRYLARTGDVGLLGALPLFQSLRALVRAHVESRRGRTELAARYLDAAIAYSHPAPAVIVACAGLPGAGKSTLARALAPDLGPAPGALILRSDEIRKRRFGVAPEQTLPLDAYAEPVSRAVMQTVFADARAAATAGHAVIADATFLDAADRAAVVAATRAAGMPFVGLWLDAPLADLERRVAGRSGDASDATIAVLHAAARATPGPKALGPAWRAVDAGSVASAERQARVILAAHRCAAPNRIGA